MDYQNLCELYTLKNIDMGLYNELKQMKLVQIKNHPNLPLKILNYTPITQMKKKWNTNLLYARGLVVNDDWKIIARPLPKFFNDYEVRGGLPSKPFEVYEKLDGSLIIMSFYEGKPIFCTRGSFTSEQAIKAQELFTEKYQNVNVDQDFTYCFEIIYPHNKIIVDYKEEEDIFLLAKIHTATGREASIKDTGFRCVNMYDQNKSLSELKHMDAENKEGFVIHFPHNNFRVKIKFKTYINLHKIGKYSRKDVVKKMAKGGEMALEQIPDECYLDLENMRSVINQQFKALKHDMLSEYANIKYEYKEEKEIIEKIKQSPHRNILFCLLRDKNCDKLIWSKLQELIYRTGF
jgi:hypothetical protein